MALLWDLFMPDNDALRKEMQIQRTKLATLLQINCKYINDLVDCLNKHKDHRPFNRIDIDNMHDLEAATESAASVIHDIKAYVKRKDPTLAKRLDTDVYDHVIPDDVPDKEGWSSILKWVPIGPQTVILNGGPLGLIPAYREKSQLQNLIQQFKDALDILEPEFENYNKNLMTVEINLSSELA